MSKLVPERNGLTGWHLIGQWKEEEDDSRRLQCRPFDYDRVSTVFQAK